MSRRKPLRLRNARKEVVLAFYIGELAARRQKSASTLGVGSGSGSYRRRLCCTTSRAARRDGSTRSR